MPVGLEDEGRNRVEVEDVAKDDDLSRSEIVDVARPRRPALFFVVAVDGCSEGAVAGPGSDPGSGSGSSEYCFLISFCNRSARPNALRIHARPS